MAVSLEFLVDMLKLELKEVEHDLVNLEKLYINRHDSSEITHYVFFENRAVLKAELDSIHRIGVLLENFVIDEYSTPEHILTELEAYIAQIVRERQFSDAVHNFTKAKINKVRKYLDM
ncbi:hypothetical protein [Spirochaeta isovalerica]|uniref:Uncharacterized protein n=1 Tax=Spirochaeta isovalerica TaxID=150 RepID=A0A841R8B8_9SPIO|nr:hypothetical protein [Spirochaeta isovalerica]MBB6478978.1 hypothetical protein [Spirochaeta isovalerica]